MNPHFQNKGLFAFKLRKIMNKQPSNRSSRILSQPKENTESGRSFIGKDIHRKWSVQSDSLVHNWQSQLPKNIYSFNSCRAWHTQQINQQVASKFQIMDINLFGITIARYFQGSTTLKKGTFSYIISKRSIATKQSKLYKFPLT